jgi:hypothetical protein
VKPDDEQEKCTRCGVVDPPGTMDGLSYCMDCMVKVLQEAKDDGRKEN